jgi:hypothetical protein
VDLIAEHQLVGFSAIIPHNHFYPVFGVNHNPDVRNPYHLAFYMLISRMVAHYAEIGVEQKIDFLFDYQPGSNSMEMVQKGWNTFITHAPPQWEPFLNKYPPNFFDDRQVLPLQAADLLAGWVRMYNEAIIFSREPPKPVWGNRGDSIKHHMRVFDTALSELVCQEMFGFKPVKFSYTFSYFYDPRPRVEI